MSPFRRAERAMMRPDQTFASGIIGDTWKIPFGVLTVGVRGSEPVFQRFSMLWNAVKTDNCSRTFYSMGGIKALVEL
jgi:hypothetical protein